MARTITVLGSTGSIGTQTLDVVREHPDEYHVVGLSAQRNVTLLAEQIRAFSPQVAAVGCAESARKLKALVGPTSTRILHGQEGYLAVATVPDACTAVVATVGSGGLRPSFAAIEAGKDVALANKEVLVMAGAIMTRAAAAYKVNVLPIDSEHSAIWQCLRSGVGREVRRIVLTASGGPFRTFRADALRTVTPKQALAHPTWDMGGKITIDSATLMNKGLEVIEAVHLFGIALDRVEVVIHPQSIIHSMVEFIDGSVIAQMGEPDMRVPIQYALSSPQRLPRGGEPLDLARIGSLTFEAPDTERFPCLRLGYDALRRGGTAPAALSVANDVAVRAFRKGEIGFLDIPAIIERVLDEHNFIAQPTLDDILRLEHEVIELATRLAEPMATVQRQG